MPRNALVMPKMSMTMEVGTMVFWLKQVGDTVAHGEPICEVTTDKVDMEVEATSSGVLVEICADQGDIVPVGDAIGFIESDTEDLLAGVFSTPGRGGDISADAPVARTATSAVPAPADEASTLNSVGDSVGGSVSRAEPVLAVPAARALAARLGLDLATIAPTGPARTIRLVDVEAAQTARSLAGRSHQTPQLDQTPHLGQTPQLGQPAAFTLTTTVTFGGVSDSDLMVPSVVLAHCVRALSRAARSNSALLRLADGSHPRDLGVALVQERVSIDGFASALVPLTALLNPENQSLPQLAERIARGATASGPHAVHLHSFLGTGIEAAQLPLPEGATLHLAIGDIANRASHVTLTAATALVPVTLASNLLRTMAYELL